MTSVYFLFTSMSTTGFGDYTPVGKGMDQNFLFQSTVYILLGIGLLARCISWLKHYMSE